MKAGVKIQDVWAFKDPQAPRYPTEKNLKMLRWIGIDASGVAMSACRERLPGSPLVDIGVQETLAI